MIDSKSVLSHPVLVLLAQLAELPVEFYVYLEIEVALVAVVGLHAKVAGKFFVLFAGDVVLQVEHGLFPVSIRCLGGSGETDSLMTLRKLNLEERH